MSEPVQPPLSPYIMVRRGPEAVDWYAKAFGAVVTERYDMDDGRLGHATLTINGGQLMLSDEFPEMQDMIGTSAPETLGGTTLSINLSVDDVDLWFDRAIRAGATAVRPPDDQFYGRHGKLRDPFGHVWSITGPKATG